VLFSDVTDMGGDSAHDVLTDGPVTIPSVQGIIAGVSCDSVAALNMNRSSNRHCVRDHNSSTGKTFHGVLMYVERHKPLVVIIENVPGLKVRPDAEVLSNLDMVLHELRVRGYLCSWEFLTPKDFAGVPQSRRRLYIVGVRRPGGDESAFTADVGSFLPSLTIKSAVPLASIIRGDNPVGSPEDHTAKRRHKDDGGADDDLLWIEEHELAFQELRLARPTTLQERLAMLPSTVRRSDFLFLSRRQQELVILLNATGSVQHGRVGISDINFSHCRVRATYDVCPCVVPSAMLWVLSDSMQRLVSSDEAFKLQGWCAEEFGIQVDRSLFSYRDCLTLAGGAFESHCVCAAFLVVLSLLD